jgi:hypothetical protein
VFEISIENDFYHGNDDDFYDKLLETKLSRENHGKPQRDSI